ncbi:MAG: sugar phosphate isomerase/epimerase family protein, partial [Beutenbergiaceae bacterium]
LGVGLVQLCDLPELDFFAGSGTPVRNAAAGRLGQLSEVAASHGIQYELGTKGVGVDRLTAYLEMAQALGSRLVRSMVVTAGHRPSTDEAVALLREVAPRYQSAGVALALETYEQIATAELVEIVDRVGCDAVGICLDPGNVVARLEHPADTVAMTAPYVLNVHVKDFAFSRSPDMVGFRFAGVRLGEGLLDLTSLLRSVRPEQRAVNLIVEQWVPWQGDSETTIAEEVLWAEHAVRRLLSAVPG